MEEAFAAAFAREGLDPSDAGYMVIDAEMPLPGPVTHLDGQTREEAK